MKPFQPKDRRTFLKLLVASPLMASAGFGLGWVEEVLAEPLHDQERYVIKSVNEALSIWDFQAAAKEKMSLAHYTELTEGVLNEETDKANREGFKKYTVRVRRLTGFGGIDQRMQLFGSKWDAPIFLCTAMAIVGHPEGNVAVARVAKQLRVMQTFGAEPPGANEAYGQPLWRAIQGPKPQPDMLKKLQSDGCPVLVWNVDHGGGGNNVGARSVQRAGVKDLERNADARCNSCHKDSWDGPEMESSGRGRITLKDSLDIIGALGARQELEEERHLTWADVKRTRDQMGNMKLVLKGILSGADADLAVKSGVDAIQISTHGGHYDDAGRGSIDCLPEVMTGAAGRIPVLIDSGFRTGVDVYKALALGATGIGIGRAYMWGLASFGEEGMAAVLRLLRRELGVIMAQTGSSSIAKISRASLVNR